METNELLIRYLKEKYLTISYVFGYHQQDAARECGLYVENVAGYRSEKIDPGYAFMGALHSRLADTGLRFCEE